jgi:hypothetical protein
VFIHASSQYYTLKHTAQWSVPRSAENIQCCMFQVPAVQLEEYRQWTHHWINQESTTHHVFIQPWVHSLLHYLPTSVYTGHSNTWHQDRTLYRIVSSFLINHPDDIIRKHLWNIGLSPRLQSATSQKTSHICCSENVKSHLNLGFVTPASNHPQQF